MFIDKDVVSCWARSGIRDGAKHMFVAKDIDYDDLYPIYVDKNQNINDIFLRFHNKGKQIVLLSLPLNRGMKFIKSRIPSSITE